MTAMSRASRRYGLLGTLAAHGLILAACLFFASSALPTPLPPAVDSVRISLGEPVASGSGSGSGSGAAGGAAVVAAAPESPEPPERVPEPEPLSEPEPLPEPQPEQPPMEESVALQKPLKEKPVKKTPRPKPAPPVARREVRPVSQPGTQAGAEGRTGGGSGTGTGSGTGSGTAEGEARATALSILIARIEGAKRYPVAARRLGLEGRVLAEVQLDAQGRITGIRARGGKTHPLLEKATLEALQRVRNSWKPVPVSGAVTLTVPVRYSLRGS